MMNYSERRIVDVAVFGIRTGIDEAGDHGASAQVEFEVNNTFNEHERGPMVTVQIGLRIDGEATVGDLEAQALTAAHGLLKRLAKEPLKSLREVYDRERDERTQRNPLAELQREIEKPTN